MIFILEKFFYRLSKSEPISNYNLTINTTKQGDVQICTFRQEQTRINQSIKGTLTQVKLTQ